MTVRDTGGLADHAAVVRGGGEMSVSELGWNEAQKVWGEWFARQGFDGVQILWGVYYLRRREVNEYILLTDEGVAPSKLAWLIQHGFAKGVRA